MNNSETRAGAATQDSKVESIESKLHSGPEAFKRLQDLTRTVLAVPKADLDKKSSGEQKRKPKRAKA